VHQSAEQRLERELLGSGGFGRIDPGVLVDVDDCDASVKPVRACWVTHEGIPLEITRSAAAEAIF
jgi:hypothetical protein